MSNTISWSVLQSGLLPAGPGPGPDAGGSRGRDQTPGLVGSALNTTRSYLRNGLLQIPEIPLVMGGRLWWLRPPDPAETGREREPGMVESLYCTENLVMQL